MDGMLKMRSMGAFYFLQIADAVTTLLFLMLGISEGNPIVHFAMAHTNPMIGLILVKGICIGAGMICSSSNRMWAVRKLNLIFTGVVAWNLLSIGARVLA